MKTWAEYCQYSKSYPFKGQTFDNHFCVFIYYALQPLIKRIDTQGGRRFCPASLKQKSQMKWSAKRTPVSRGFC